MHRLRPLCLFAALSVLALLSGESARAAGKTAEMTPQTPEPKRFVVRGNILKDLQKPNTPVFFKGMGYSPFLIGETPLNGADPKDDGRFATHLAMMRELGIN